MRKLGSPSSNSETEKWQIVELHHTPVLPDTSSADLPNTASILGVLSKATTKTSPVELLLNPTINPITSKSVILTKVKADPNKSTQPNASEKSVLAKPLAIQKTKKSSTTTLIPTDSETPTKSITKYLAGKQAETPSTSPLIPTKSDTPTKAKKETHSTKIALFFVSLFVLRLNHRQGT